ncbi:MAG: formylglycine-generating enzyme family protein, partial [Opitutaceae bacterium]|nr:formylglycine-generating enzyme family protein [Opitutaceae bacterium]
MKTRAFEKLSGWRLGVFTLLLLTGCGPKSTPAPAPRAIGGHDSQWPAKPRTGQVFTLKEIDLDLQPIPAGTFRMGSPLDEPGQSAAEGPWTWVKISQPFWLGRTPVTHGQWRAIMGTDLATQARKAFPGDDQPAKFLTGTDDAVAMQLVSWHDAMAFCAKLNAQAQAAGTLPAGYEYTLPTEAQWEYACRAGTTEATYAGPLVVLAERNAPVLDDIAWYAGNSSVGYRGSGWNTQDWVGKQYPGGRAGPRQVGLKQPNG